MCNSRNVSNVSVMAIYIDHTGLFKGWEEKQVCLEIPRSLSSCNDFIKEVECNVLLFEEVKNTLISVVLSLLVDI